MSFLNKYWLKADVVEDNILFNPTSNLAAIYSWDSSEAVFWNWINMSTPPEDTPLGDRRFRENVPLSERRARRLAEAEERRKLEGDIWWFCCHLSERERRSAELAIEKYEYEVRAKLHFEFVLHTQQIAVGRWPELCRLRSMEIFGGKIGLVLKFETYMRKLDRILAIEGIFINHTPRILEDPLLGTIPQLPVNFVIPDENIVVDLTWCSLSTFKILLIVS